MKLSQLCNDARQRLAIRFGDGEAQWMVRIMMEHLKSYTPVDLAVKADNEVSRWLVDKVEEAVGRLLTDEPIQYIFGEARFYGMKLRVTPDTLIPRPETEELVDLIVHDNAGCADLRVIDACTGSGCIAVALARNLPFAHVAAFDISAPALAVAEENARKLKARIDFFEADALALPCPPAPLYDIVVSNPPYIADSEKVMMDANVLHHEPHGALFVPDASPLMFYEALVKWAESALTAGGRLYFEVNPIYARHLADSMTARGWEDVTLMPDIRRTLRFLIAYRPSE